MPIKQVQKNSLQQVLRSLKIENMDKFSIPLGFDKNNHLIVRNIKTLPHIFISGEFGSGKTTLLKTWICSLLMQTKSSELQLILIDIKIVEFITYHDILQLFVPVIVTQKEAINNLKWLVQEMERRYGLFINTKAKNLDTYNSLSGLPPLPRLVVFIDELADLILALPAETENNICKILQMGVVTGIHLVISSQHLSSNIFTGLINVNMPSRIAFTTINKEASEIIIFTGGAEKLQNPGEMIYYHCNEPKPIKIKSINVTDEEIEAIISRLRKNTSVIQKSQNRVTTAITVNTKTQSKK